MLRVCGNNLALKNACKYNIFVLTKSLSTCKVKGTISTNICKCCKKPASSCKCKISPQCGNPTCQCASEKSKSKSVSGLVGLEGPSAFYNVHKPGGYFLYKRIAFFFLLPVICAVLANCILNHHEHERPPYVPWDHMYIHTKRWPWGEGKKSLFHNPKVNALPDGEGYEEEE